MDTYMAHTIGIDLGTTNSAVAALDERGEPYIIVNNEGARTTPSVVARTEQGELLTGITAKRQHITNPTNTASSVKRLMGQRFDSSYVTHAHKRLTYKITRSENGDAWLQLGGELVAPPEVAAIVLQKLKTDAELYLGEDVTDAVITVPAYFNEGQRNATKAAGAIAGLNVLRIINEPTAAAIAYGRGKMATNESSALSASTIAVYDLGGGTFDISILRLDAGVFQVISTAGDAFLGGDDFDSAIVDHITTDFRNQTGIDLSADPPALARITEAAETAKIELSSATTSRILLPFITADTTGPRNLEYEFTRTELDRIVSPLILRTLEPCEQALADADVTFEDIDEVLLVGGQTRMPAVQEVVQEYFGQQPSHTVNPDEVVALGAAIQGGILSGDVEQALLLLDVTSQTLGNATIGNEFAPIIPRNTTIPTSATETFYTVLDNQTGVIIEVMQGESDVASENTKLGEFVLNGIRRAAAGTVAIEVTFIIDSNGMLTARAEEVGTGKATEIILKEATGLTQGQVEEMTEKASRRRRDEQSR